MQPDMDMYSTVDPPALHRALVHLQPGVVALDEAAFSFQGYRSALGGGSEGVAVLDQYLGDVRDARGPDAASFEPPPPSTPPRVRGDARDAASPEAQTPPVPKRALRQAEAIMEGVDLATELRTWVSSSDSEGYTFTQSLCSGVTDIIDPPRMGTSGILDLQVPPKPPKP